MLLHGEVKLAAAWGEDRMNCSELLEAEHDKKAEAGHAECTLHGAMLMTVDTAILAAVHDDNDEAVADLDDGDEEDTLGICLVYSTCKVGVDHRCCVEMAVGHEKEEEEPLSYSYLEDTPCLEYCDDGADDVVRLLDDPCEDEDDNIHPSLRSIIIARCCLRSTVLLQVKYLLPAFALSASKIEKMSIEASVCGPLRFSVITKAKDVNAPPNKSKAEGETTWQFCRLLRDCHTHIIHGLSWRSVMAAVVC